MDFKTDVLEIKKSYQHVKVNSMVRALLCNKMKKNLKITQIAELTVIKEKYNRNNYISKVELDYLWLLYYNYVLLDYRYENTQIYKKTK